MKNLLGKLYKSRKFNRKQKRQLDIEAVELFYPKNQQLIVMIGHN